MYVPDPRAIDSHPLSLEPRLSTRDRRPRSLRRGRFTLHQSHFARERERRCPEDNTRDDASTNLAGGPTAGIRFLSGQIILIALIKHGCCCRYARRRLYELRVARARSNGEKASEGRDECNALSSRVASSKLVARRTCHRSECNRENQRSRGQRRERHLAPADMCARPGDRSRERDDFEGVTRQEAILGPAVL